VGKKKKTTTNGASFFGYGGKGDEKKSEKIVIHPKKGCLPLCNMRKHLLKFKLENNGKMGLTRGPTVWLGFLEDDCVLRKTQE